MNLYTRGDLVELWDYYLNIPKSTNEMFYILKHEAWKRYTEVRDNKEKYFYDIHDFNGVMKVARDIEPLNQDFHHII